METAGHTDATMADEEIDLEALDKELDQEGKVEKRIRALSEKVKFTSEERDSARHESEEKDKKISELEKERGFLSSFGDQTTKYPDAIAFRDKIKEKVLVGYSVEDATVSVLNSEGKLFTTKKEVSLENPAGGSAPTSPQVSVDKKVSEMSREEKRNALLEAEKRGDLGVN